MLKPGSNKATRSWHQHGTTVQYPRRDKVAPPRLQSLNPGAALATGAFATGIKRGFFQDCRPMGTAQNHHFDLIAGG